MNTDSQLFASLVLVVGVLGPLVIAGLFVEHLLPRLRRERRKHVHRMARYRAQQRASAVDIHDQQRRKAAEWLASNCFWRQDR
jgi:Flp pilus assembly protein TadB